MAPRPVAPAGTGVQSGVNREGSVPPWQLHSPLERDSPVRELIDWLRELLAPRPRPVPLPVPVRNPRRPNGR
jgi:hypothetical protein